MTTAGPEIIGPGNCNEYVPRRQYSHLAHDETQEIRIRSPAPKVVTPSPTESITPTPSCPWMRSGAQVGAPPLRICRSVPQMFLRRFRSYSVTQCRPSFGFDVRLAKRRATGGALRRQEDKLIDKDSHQGSGERLTATIGQSWTSSPRQARASPRTSVGRQLLRSGAIA